MSVSKHKVGIPDRLIIDGQNSVCFDDIEEYL